MPTVDAGTPHFPSKKRAALSSLANFSGVERIGKVNPLLLNLGQFLSGQHHQLPGDVVKAGPQIREEIPDYAREARRRLGCDDTFDTYLISVRLEDDIMGFCAYVPGGSF